MENRRNHDFLHELYFQSVWIKVTNQESMIVNLKLKIYNLKSDLRVMELFFSLSSERC